MSTSDPRDPRGILREHVTRELLAGWGAGIVETCLLYPANKLIFRQQLHGVKLVTATSQLRAEGPTLLFRGLLPPLVMRSLSRALMFGLYDSFVTRCASLGRSTNGMTKASLFSPCHASAAFLAGACEATLCPLERVQVLLQTHTHHDTFENTASAFRGLFKEFGLKEFFRGLSVIVTRNGFSNILFFGLREPLRDYGCGTLDTAGGRRFLAEFVSGALLGASISTFFFPLNVIKSRIQSEVGGPYLRATVVLRMIIRERGSALALYRGAHLNVGRSLVAWGITNSVYEMLHRKLAQMAAA